MCRPKATSVMLSIALLLQSMGREKAKPLALNEHSCSCRSCGNLILWEKNKRLVEEAKVSNFGEKGKKGAFLFVRVGGRGVGAR